jgi:hypothetical protein
VASENAREESQGREFEGFEDFFGMIGGPDKNENGKERQAMRERQEEMGGWWADLFLER